MRTAAKRIMALGLVLVLLSGSFWAVADLDMGIDGDLGESGLGDSGLGNSGLGSSRLGVSMMSAAMFLVKPEVKYKNATSLGINDPFHYNGIIFNEWDATQADVEGPVAVRGKATFGEAGQFDVGASAHDGIGWQVIGNYKNPHGYPGLLMGTLPEIHENASTVHVYGGDAVMSIEDWEGYQYSNRKFNTPTKDEYTDPAALDKFFKTLERTFNDASAGFVTTGETISLNPISIGQLNSFSISYGTESKFSQFEPSTKNPPYLSSRAKVLTINVSGKDVAVSSPSFPDFKNYDVVIINFPEAESVTFTGSMWYAGNQLHTSAPWGQMATQNTHLREAAGKLVWNMPKADSISIKETGVAGSVLAPVATVDTKGGSLNGRLICENLNQTGGFELHNLYPDFEIDPDEPENPYVELPEVDLDLGFIRLRKKDYDTGKVLPGAVFELQQKNNHGVFQKYQADAVYGPFPYEEATESEKDDEAHFRTSEKGEIVIFNLPKGVYRLVEVTAPDGYSLPTDSGEIYAEFTIDAAVIKTQKQLIEAIISGDHDLWYRMDVTEVYFNEVENQKDSSEKTGGIRFYKVDKTKEYIDILFLSGAEFAIDMQVGVGSGWRQLPGYWTSDRNGMVEVTGLEVGHTYRIREIKAPDGYKQPGSQPDDQVVAEFTLTPTDAGEIIELSHYIENEPDDYYFIIEKKMWRTDGAVDQGKDNRLTGAWFEVYYSPTGSTDLEGDWQRYGTLGPTDEDGIIRFSIPYKQGVTFRLQELKAPDGYKYSEDHNYYQTGVINLDREDRFGNPVYLSGQENEYLIEVYNEQLEPDEVLGSVTIYKVDEDDHTSSVEATFGLYRHDENGNCKFLNRYLATDDVSGEGIIRDLELGITYCLKELNVQYGYTLDDSCHVFTLTEDAPDPSFQSNPITNKKDRDEFGKLEIFKSAELNPREGLAGARFKLEQYRDNKWQVYNAAKTLETDSNGELLVELPFGTYRLWEVNAPDGYVLTGGVQAEFTLTKENSYYRTYWVRVTNKEVDDGVYGEVTLIKRDSRTKQLLKNAVFHLQMQDPATGEWFAHSSGHITNADGIIHIKNLPAGTYRFVESRAPNGYYLDSMPSVFTISESGRNPHITIWFDNTSTTGGGSEGGSGGGSSGGSSRPDDHDRGTTVDPTPDPDTSEKVRDRTSGTNDADEDEPVREIEEIDYYMIYYEDIIALSGWDQPDTGVSSLMGGMLAVGTACLLGGGILYIGGKRDD